jgi:hypothetical protein
MNLVVGSASYNETAKARFKKESMALLRKVARILELVKGSYDVRYNAAGIACSGDATLHAEDFYVSFNLDCMESVLVRTCKGRRDYTGGPNRWYSFAQLAQEGAEGLAECIRKIREGC